MQRPEIIDKLMAIIDQKNIQVNDNNRFTYLNFLSAARAAQDNPDGWVERSHAFALLRPECDVMW